LTEFWKLSFDKPCRLGTSLSGIVYDDIDSVVYP